VAQNHGTLWVKLLINGLTGLFLQPWDVPSLEKGISAMSKYYIKSTEALKGLRADTAGVVSFEYVIVAACVVGAVVLAFGTGANGAMTQALSNAITNIMAKVTLATG
jgi:pilus assembly protein Flp/PilA